MLAAYDSDPKAVKLFLDHQADPNAQNQQGLSPLHFATHAAGRNDRLETNGLATAELLLAEGAKVNLPDYSGTPPLSLLLRQGRSPTVLNLEALLRRHGAVTHLPDFSTLRITRKGLEQDLVVFRQDTNALNHFTLFEVIGAYYVNPTTGAPAPRRQLRTPLPPGPGGISPPLPGLISPSPPGVIFPFGVLPFPDLARVRVHRPLKDRPAEEQVLPAPLSKGTNTFDCSQDIVLQFGDVVELPEREHSLAENPVALTGPQSQELGKCLQREVVFVSKDQRATVVLSGTGDCYLSAALRLHPVQALLRSSSDFSRVRVQRTEPGQAQPREIVRDVRPFWDGKEPQSNDLWLRDGDVVEVPDEPGML